MQARREELNQKINDESERLRIEEETELEEYLESIPEGEKPLGKYTSS